MSARSPHQGKGGAPPETDELLATAGRLQERTEALADSTERLRVRSKSLAASTARLRKHTQKLADKARPLETGESSEGDG